ncbi:MAG: PLP-dependent aminotransferase family protein [Pseudomonadota bacterium]
MWVPTLDEGHATVSGRLLDALRRDIDNGTLPPGTRLPPHRELAHRLGIGIGTVTAVYGEAARHGLLNATVGRGSFVADRRTATTIADAGAGPIDLAQNLPPSAPAQRRLSAVLARLSRRGDMASLLDYAPPAGQERHRQAAAGWIRRVGGLGDARADRMVITDGAQQAMLYALGALCRPGDTVLTESATYFGIRSIAQTCDLRLVGLDMDEQGIRPDALERAAQTGARVLYTMPTLQNPTGRTMGDARRRDIAALASRHGLWIVEDDLYSAFAAGFAPPPLASYAPNRTLYINGTSKALAPGLRTGYLILPDAELLDRVLRQVRAHVYAPCSIGPTIACQWMEDGSADEIVAEISEELAARGDIARLVLGDLFVPPADRRCPHLWLPLPELDAERIAARAMRAGVQVTPPSAPLIEPRLISGIRLCLGPAADRAQLRTALDRLAGGLDADHPEPAAAVV